MSNNVNSARVVDKERIRQEINRQVEAFLNKGGEIDVVVNAGNGAPAERGTVWHNQDEITEILE
jgi:hypothetical protein